MAAGYQALSSAIQRESAQELVLAEDEYAVSVEATVLLRKNRAMKYVAKLKSEEAMKEKAYQRIMEDISREKYAIQRAIEQEKIRKREEEERKRAEEQRIQLEALEKKRREEEAQRKKLEEEQRRREEAERKKREEAERKKAEEERKIREEAERKRMEEERKEQERKRLEEEANKKRQDEEAAKQRQAEEEAAKKQEEEEKQRAEQLRSEPPVVPVASTSASPTSTTTASTSSTEATTQAEKERRKEAKKYISPKALEEYQAVMRDFKGMMQTVQALEANPAFNDTKRRLTMDINLKLGQLCPDNQVVKDRTADVVRLCQEAAGQGDAVFLYSLHILNVRMMRQTALVEKALNVFPLATLAVTLMQRFPTLVPILIAKFYTYCPYTVPRYPKRKAGQSEAEFRQAMGYAVVEGKLEDESAFYARMEGAVRLYAAIIQTPVTGTHPYGVAHGWTWLARLANLPPQDITVTVLRVFLEIAGHELHKVYKTQFHKLMVYFLHEFLPKCPTAARPSDYSRLLKYLQSYLQTGVLSPPAGRDFT